MIETNKTNESRYVNVLSPLPRHVVRSSEKVQVYPPIDGLKFPWSGEEIGDGGERKGAAAEAPTRKVCDLVGISMAS